MTLVYQYKVLLSGWNGGPGMNTIHLLSFEEGTASQGALQDGADQIQAAYNAMKQYFVGFSTFTLLPEVKALNVGDASLVELRNVAGWAVSTASSATTSSRATMAKMRFITDRVRGNRILRGGIYFGPIDDDAIESDGTLKQSAKTALAAAWNGLTDVNITDQMRLAVYGRPDPTNKNPAVREGVTGYVQSVSVMPVPAVLRSRRD